MKQKGQARQAALKIIGWTLIFVIAVLGGGVVAVVVGSAITLSASFLIVFWIGFAGFVLYFFRDPTPQVPLSPQMVVSPTHGTVDMIDEVEEPEFMGGRCRRISIFLSIFDVHIQKAPAAGRIALLKHQAGEFLNAMKLEAAARNENVLIGLESSERAHERIGVRLIAGVIARRIVPWIALGDAVERGERISLIQFGSRCDLYLPLSMNVAVKLGDKVVGGESIMANRS